MREILFRGQKDDLSNMEWLYGSLIIRPHPLTRNGLGYFIGYVEDGTWYETQVIPSTLGQFTGLHDKNGKRIFEGDRVEYFSYKMYTQQSHPDIAPEIYEPVLLKKSGVVVFEECEFRIDECNLNYIGFPSILELKAVFFGDGHGLTEEEMECDIDGNELGEHCVGMKIIGNIHEEVKP